MARKSFGRAYLSRTIRIHSIRKGLFGGSTFWLVVFGARLIGSRTKAFTKRGEMPIRFSQKLAVGERLDVAHLDPSTKQNSK